MSADAERIWDELAPVVPNLGDGQGRILADFCHCLAELERQRAELAKEGTIIKPHVPSLKENNVRTGFFERHQFEELRKHLPADLRPMVTFAFITGWRIDSEVLPLQWSRVDFEAGPVRLDAGTTKNDSGRTFPMTAGLRDILEAQRLKTQGLQRQKGIICPWVFHRNGRPIKYFRRSWLTACQKAGIPGRIPHDLRRTAVRNLVRAGIPERVAMQMTGHKTRCVFERYNIVSEADLSNAARLLEKAFEG